MAGDITRKPSAWRSFLDALEYAEQSPEERAELQIRTLKAQVKVLERSLDEK